MTKAELVAMDERFIHWLASPDTDYKKWETKRFIIVKETADVEVSITGFDTLKELKKFAEIDEPESGWFVIAIFHLYGKKQLRYSRKIIIKIS